MDYTMFGYCFLFGRFCGLVYSPGAKWLEGMRFLAHVTRRRSILLVYDLWGGELLNSCEIFTSLLVQSSGEGQTSSQCSPRGFQGGAQALAKCVHCD